MYEMQDADWIIEETKLADFGDKRLNKRYGDILNSFAASPTKSIPASFKSWKETLAAYRFLNHENVTVEEILAPHRRATIERIKNEKIILIPQDTTEIDFSGRKPISGMGYLSNKNSHGFYLHPSLAVTPDRNCLGVIDVQTSVRNTIGEKSKSRRDIPIQEKESYRWLKGYEAANAVALEAPDTLVISIADREGDIYELLEKAHCEESKSHWLIRLQYDRSTLNEIGESTGLRLREMVNASNPLGEIEFTLTPGKIYNSNAWRRKPREERIVRQEIRAQTVYLKPPHHKRNLKSVRVHVVHCREINPPSDEERIEWFLLTSVPIKNGEESAEVVRWYLCRWQIEIFFKILKSGCKVEEVQFESFQATSNCIALYLVVAWRILYLTMLGRNCPDMPCDNVFEENEWHSVYAIITKKTPPKIPPKLNEIIFMIAKLGGFLARKSDGYPGPTVMWIGLQRMKDFTLAWESFRELNKTYV